MSWRSRLANWPGIAFFRLRLFFRGVFLLLALATVAIALSVLQDEKELSLDPLRQGAVLWRGHRVNLPLTAQRILAALHARRGEVVSYDELFQVVKTGRNRDNVRKHISTIREAFRDIDPNFEGIESVPMRGFRWLATPAPTSR